MAGSVTNRALRILQVNAYDVAGGAEKVAFDLFRSYRARGRQSWLAVGFKRSAEADVLSLRPDAPPDAWGLFCLALNDLLEPLARRAPGVWRVRDFLRKAAFAQRQLNTALGREHFYFPATRRLLSLPPQRPDVLHCHNLHGGYFDLRELPRLSRQAPLVLTLHDAWLLSGHCAHSFNCERWQSGCGHCPDLTIYPALQRDATAFNWRRKRGIYARSRLFIAAPSRWLMQKVERSMLAPGAAQMRVIPNGVDLTTFHPADKLAARVALNIPPQAAVLLIAANGIRQNQWKDYQTLRAAVARVAAQMPGRAVLFLGLGDDAPPERMGEAEVRFVPFQSEAATVARYYQAADVYVHAARADTFPNTVLEALACGTPVVATAVGGIPEQIRSLPESAEATGVLTPPGDAAALATAVARLLSDSALQTQLSRHAAADARQRFDFEREVSDYLAWYDEILARCQGRPCPQ